MTSNIGGKKFWAKCLCVGEKNRDLSKNALFYGNSQFLNSNNFFLKGPIRLIFRKHLSIHVVFMPGKYLSDPSLGLGIITELLSFPKNDLFERCLFACQYEGVAS